MGLTVVVEGLCGECFAQADDIGMSHLPPFLHCRKGFLTRDLASCFALAQLRVSGSGCAKGRPTLDTTKTVDSTVDRRYSAIHGRLEPIRLADAHTMIKGQERMIRPHFCRQARGSRVAEVRGVVSRLNHVPHIVWDKERVQGVFCDWRIGQKGQRGRVEMMFKLVLRSLGLYPVVDRLRVRVVVVR